MTIKISGFMLTAMNQGDRFELRLILSEKSFTIHWSEVKFVQHGNKSNV